MPRRDAHVEHLAGVALLAACTSKGLQRIQRVADELSVEGGRLVQQRAVGRTLDTKRYG